MKQIYVNQIKERDWIDAPFLVREKIMGMAKNGRPYLTIKLMDRTGEVEGRVWERVDELASCFAKDDFIHVSGKATVYLGRMQLVIQDLKPLAEAEIDLADFLPVSARPVAEMLTELKQKVESLKDVNLRHLMDTFLNDQEFLHCFSRAPAAKSMHHVCLGGLLEHSLAVAGLADDISRRYPEVNRDLLLVGALLHDVGKISELRYDRSFEYTDAGKLLGHIMIGVEIVEEKLRNLKAFPEGLAVQLKHLLLSHHGQYEFGSPKRPKTIEAVILNFIDDLDSKINGVMSHIDKEPDSDSSWTQYHRLYDRYFFKGSPITPMQTQAQVPKTQDKVQQAAVKTDKPVRSRFSNTLEEQLQNKSLDLFSAIKPVKNDE